MNVSFKCKFNKKTEKNWKGKIKLKFIKIKMKKKPKEKVDPRKNINEKN